MKVREFVCGGGRESVYVDAASFDILEPYIPFDLLLEARIQRVSYPVTFSDRPSLTIDTGCYIDAEHVTYCAVV